jgi:tetratricopeptide (TPR) repeat protein
MLRAILASMVLALAATAHAAESDPLPVPKEGPRALAVALYNAGVKLMVERRFADAQAQFEAALKADDTLPEAHNNLAFSLRMQGAGNFERALHHYNRALELQPRLARAYLYRGVMFTQMGDMTRARADHGRVQALDPALAQTLLDVIEGAAANDGYGGLQPQFD